MIGFSILALIIPALTIALMILGVYTLFLVIKALQIYIRKNGGY